MLHAAMRECYGLNFGDMQAALSSAVSSLDTYAEPSLALPLVCIASDMGIESADSDLALTAALMKLDLGNDKEVLHLLPCVAAAVFVSEKWERSNYLPKLCAFENNEHCIQDALVKLFGSFFILSQTSLSPDGRLAAENTKGKVTDTSFNHDMEDEGGVENKKVSKPLAVRERYKAYVERYLRISAQTLLVQRENEGKDKKYTVQLPHRSMTQSLEYFTVLCPIVSRGTLEKYFPNYLIHSDALDVSLGRQKTSDHLKNFTHHSEAASAGAAQIDANEQF